MSKFGESSHPTLLVFIRTKHVPKTLQVLSDFEKNDTNIQKRGYFFFLWEEMCVEQRHTGSHKKGSAKNPLRAPSKDGDGRWNRKEIAAPRTWESYAVITLLAISPLRVSIHRYKCITKYYMSYFYTQSQFSLILVNRNDF